MGKNYLLKISLLSLCLGGLALGADAQALQSDSVRWPAPSRVLLKAGLRLTHFSYSGSSQTWRVVVPLSVGAEYRLLPRLAFYGQADADLQASRAAGRRGARRNLLPSAALGLGLRYYYRQPDQGHPRRTTSPFGNYLALEGSVERTELAGTFLTVSQSRRQRPPASRPAYTPTGARSTGCAAPCSTTLMLAWAGKPRRITTMKALHQRATTSRRR